MRGIVSALCAVAMLALWGCGGGGGTSGGQRPGPVTQAPEPPNPPPPAGGGGSGGGGSLATVAAAGAPAFTWLAVEAPASQARSWGESLREGGALSPVEATIADTLRGADDVLRRHTWSGVHVRGLQSDEFEAWGAWGTWNGLTNVAFAVRRDFGETDRFSALIEGNPAGHAPVFGEWSGLVKGYSRHEDGTPSERFVGKVDLEIGDNETLGGRAVTAQFTDFRNLTDGGTQRVKDLGIISKSHIRPSLCSPCGRAGDARDRGRGQATRNSPCGTTLCGVWQLATEAVLRDEIRAVNGQERPL